MKEYCKSCKTDKGLAWDKQMILKYGKCAKCILEADLGHEYNPKTWVCPCGKELKTFKGSERHKSNCDFLKISLKIQRGVVSFNSGKNA